jgi:NADPH:quinone reductase-like Zn-dependent oxidoreductase
MKACRIHRFGGPDVIEVEDIAPPEPDPVEARVRVEASGVGPWDAWIRSGKSVVPQPLPLTLGVDISGEIDRLGDGVTDLRVGEPVFGATKERFTGANAEYAIASVARLAPKPRRISFAQAAAVPVVAVTAWQALFDEAKLGRGESVLITARRAASARSPCSLRIGLVSECWRQPGRTTWPTWAPSAQVSSSTTGPNDLRIVCAASMQ